MKTLKRFAHLNPATVDEASTALQKGNAALIAGGTDLLGALRFEVLPDYPEVVVNLKRIPGLDYIREKAGLLKIGALTKLEDIPGAKLYATNTLRWHKRLPELERPISGRWERLGAMHAS